MLQQIPKENLVLLNSSLVSQLLSLDFLVKKFVRQLTQDHCGEGGLVLVFVHSCRPEASLHMYLSVGRPLWWWNSAQGMQGHL